MDQHQVEIEALTDFRDASVRYRGDLLDVFQQGEREISAALRRMEDLRADWQQQVRQRTMIVQDCHRQAMAAAMEGGWMDCSGVQARLQAAEQQLAAVIRAHDRVQRAVDTYRQRCHDYAAYLDDPFARGQEYLRHCISEYSRFAQQQLMPAHLEQMLKFNPPFLAKEPLPTGRLGAARGLGPRGGSERSAGGGPESGG